MSNIPHTFPTTSTNSATAMDAVQDIVTSAVSPDDAIERIMSLSVRKDVTSFLGGFPSNAVQCWRELQHLTVVTLKNSGHESFGYGPTQGLPGLCRLLSERMDVLGRPTSPEEVLVSAGGIAALDLIAASFCKAGDSVAVLSPTYMGALQVFTNHGCDVQGVRTNDSGLDLDALEATFKKAVKRQKRIKFLYLVPSFDNPTGKTISLVDRQALIDLATQYGCWIIEDGAYQEIYFDQPPPPMLTGICPERVIHINTFSKTLCPGFRLGWVVAPKEIITQLLHRKQSWDQCSSTFGQQIAITALNTGYMNRQLRKGRKIYAKNCEALQHILDRELGDYATWSKPEGGFYFWLKLRNGANAQTVSEIALKHHKVAVMSGHSFYAHDPDLTTMRLSFSEIEQSNMDKGIDGLKQAITTSISPN